jgi:lipopolysaccharide/colanic/teichoic acid biosynthesis glycosyltransferase
MSVVFRLFTSRFKRSISSLTNRKKSTENFYEQATGKSAIFGSDAEGLDFKEKKIFDFVCRISSFIFGVVGLILTLPFYPFIIMAIKLESKGSAFFIQERLGKDGKPLKFIKFRTMSAEPNRQNLESNWMKIAVPETEEPDITPTGKFLRKYKIDEIPQFVSLIKGDLNLIGPRPESIRAFEERTKRIPFYAERLRIRPGITGWAQSHPIQTIPEKLEFDLFYIRHRSLLLDLLIILKTFKTILHGSDR